MYKKCTIVMLPTDKAENAILVFNGKNKFAEYHKQYFTQQYLKSMGTDGCNIFHLYILSDDEINNIDECWVFGIKLNRIGTNNWRQSYSVKDNFKKIIATTDSSLHAIKFRGTKLEAPSKFLKDIAVIPQSFIEHYVSEYNKANKIKEVMVEYTDEFKDNIIDLNPMSDYPVYGDKLQLKLNPDNTINIKSIKDSWTKEEIISLCNAAYYHKDQGKGLPYDYNDNSFDKWLESNL